MPAAGLMPQAPARLWAFGPVIGGTGAEGSFPQTPTLRFLHQLDGLSVRLKL